MKNILISTFSTIAVIILLLTIIMAGCRDTIEEMLDRCNCRKPEILQTNNTINTNTTRNISTPINRPINRQLNIISTPYQEYIFNPPTSLH